MPTRPTIGRTNEEIVNEIKTSAVYYKKIKTDIEKLAVDADELNKEIKEAIKQEGIAEKNGAHLELTAPLGDGKQEVFVQLQRKQAVKTVDNIISLIRDKLGEKEAGHYIRTVEVLHDNALTTLFNNGLITADEVNDWTVVKESESLIVKIQNIK